MLAKENGDVADDTDGIRCQAIADFAAKGVFLILEIPKPDLDQLVGVQGQVDLRENRVGQPPLPDLNRGFDGVGEGTKLTAR